LNPPEDLPAKDLPAHTDAAPDGLRRRDFVRRAAVAGAAATSAGALIAGPGAGAALADGKGKRAPEAVTSIHQHLNGFSHWDMNVADRDKSRAWYEATTGMRMFAETSSDQAFPSLGIAHGRWKGYMMKDELSAPPAPMIHLVEWETPAVVGTAYQYASNVGWSRLAQIVADTATARAAVEAQGSKPFFNVPPYYNPPAWPGGPRIYYDSFCVRDPDGVINQFAKGGQFVSVASAAKLVAVASATANDDLHAPFYAELLGLDAGGALQTSAPWRNIYDETGGYGLFEGVGWVPRGDTRVGYDWLEWEVSRQHPTPYKEPNHRGIIRSSIEVDDIEACYDILRRSWWNRKYNIVLGPPEEWDFGPGFSGKRTVVNFKSEEGVYFQLIQQAPQAALPAGANYPNGLSIFPQYGHDLFPPGGTEG